MAKRAELKAKLSLNSTAFSRGIKTAMKEARDLGASIAGGAVRRGVSAMKALSVSALGLGAALAYGVKRAVQAAADMEGMETSFAVLLGSMEAAKKRMAELSKFAAETPFELPEVVAASKTLETMTKGAIATGEGLRLVGDVAAGTGMQFGEAAMWIGRLYDALQNGRPAGEALMRLQEVGAISGAARARLESAAPGEGWKIATQELGKFSGMMEKQSRTWNGLMSTFRDNIGAAMREFGTPIITQMKPALDAAIELAGQIGPKMKGAGVDFAKALDYGVNVGLGILKDPKTATKMLEDALVATMLRVGNVMIAAFKAGLDFFKNGLMEGMAAAGQVMLGTMMKAFQEPIALLQAGVEAAIAKLPESLGGVDEKKQMEEQRKAAYAQMLAISAKQKKLLESNLPDAEKGKRYDELQARYRKIEAEQYDPARNWKPPTLEDRKNRILKEGVRIGFGNGMTADEMIAAGKGNMDASIQKAIEAVKGMKVEDVMGAGAYDAKVAASSKALAAKGAAERAAITAPKTRLTRYGSQLIDIYGRKAAEEYMKTGKLPASATGVPGAGVISTSPFASTAGSLMSGGLSTGSLSGGGTARWGRGDKARRQAERAKEAEQKNQLGRPGVMDKMLDVMEKAWN